MALLDIDVPERYALVTTFGGEVIGSASFTSRPAADKRKAELEQRFPRHQIHLYSLEAAWTEVS